MAADAIGSVPEGIRPDDESVATLERLKAISGSPAETALLELLGQTMFEAAIATRMLAILEARVTALENAGVDDVADCDKDAEGRPFRF